ncbi:cytochrome P450 [Kitasatospora aureofaciens]|uniref:cytochrome P450 family protein n=1 Tax=Kitasatospora aureofaciens TaxID=1894 RepID=UPI001C453166|nr:cytochrome P450 [Kitasatospora aureofaciens]MBV6703119.1 cytochrome P450 [Kitasatospora aureofaciens]
MASPVPVLPQPFRKEFAAAPYVAYRRLIEAGPIHQLEVAPGLLAWVVCGYEESRALLIDRRLSIEPASTTSEVRGVLLSLATEEKQSLYGRHLLATDPPDHTRMRKVMSAALTARRLRSLEIRVQEITDTLLNDLADRERADLLTDFALPLTILVLVELIGLPADGALLFGDLGLQVLRGDAEHDDVFLQVIQSLAAYLGDLIADPQAVSPHGLMALLLAAEKRMEISTDELNSLLFQLFFAGHESTGYFIANAIATLLQHPGELARLRQNPELIDGALEELLRFEGSVKSATWRFPTEPIEVAGALIPAGDPVLVLFGAANRDPRQFDHPDRLDLGRASTGHLSFSHGAHHCLGHALGRMEAKIAVLSLFSRFPDVQLDGPYEELPWRHNLVMRGMSRLPVVLSR